MISGVFPPNRTRNFRRFTYNFDLLTKMVTRAMIRILKNSTSSKMKPKMISGVLNQLAHKNSARFMNSRKKKKIKKSMIKILKNSTNQKMESKMISGGFNQFLHENSAGFMNSFEILRKTNWKSHDKNFEKFDKIENWTWFDIRRLQSTHKRKFGMVHEFWSPQKNWLKEPWQEFWKIRQN